MSTTRPFAFNTGTTISGTTQIGSLAIGVSAQDYSSNPGGVKWWMGPDEELGYIIGVPVLAQNHPTPVGNIGGIEFWRSSGLTNESFINISNIVAKRKVYNTPFTTTTGATIWLSSSGYTSSFIYNSEAVSLIDRMVNAGEEPSSSRKSAIYKCISSLKSSDLFDTQFDVLVVTRGHGAASTKMNWIKNSSNAIAVNSPTFTTDIGYNNDGTAKYLNSKFMPLTDGILFKQNDACFGYKVSGTLSSYGSSTKYHGGGDSAGTHGLTGGEIFNVNVTYSQNGGMVTNAVIGYNCGTRSSATVSSLMQNSITGDYNVTSTGLSNAEIYILAWDHVNAVYYWVDSGEVIEIYWLGKSMTQSKFLTFQTIMNAYFAGF